MTEKKVKRPGPLSLALICILVLAASTSADGDSMIFDNGDKISGRIAHISDNSVHIVTDYAGEINIDFARVADMNTDREVRIILENGDVITGKVDSISDGLIAVSSQALGAIQFPRDHFRGLYAGEIPVAEAIGPDMSPGAAAAIEATREQTGVEPREKAKEAEDLAAPADLWSGSFSVGGQLQRGNTDTADLHIEAKAKRTAPREELDLRIYSDYRETDGDTDTNKVFGQVKIKVFHTERAYMFGITDMEYDEMENLALRAQVFGGMGYVFIDKERSKMLAEIGAGLTGEFFDDNEETLEGSLWLSAEWRQSLPEGLEFYQALTLYPSLGDLGDLRLRSETALKAPLGERWAIKFAVIDDYDNNPESEDVEKNDLKLISSAEYAF